MLVSRKHASSDAEAASGYGAYLLTWKETGTPHEIIMQLVKRFERNGFVDDTWRLLPKSAKPGDHAWLLKQGDGPKGIFGFGIIMKVYPRRKTAQDQDTVPQVARVKFLKFTDPRGRHLIDEEKVCKILPPSKIRTQFSGVPLTREEADALDKLLDASSQDQVIDPSAADPSPFNPSTMQDERQRTASTIALRRGQRDFRYRLIAAYGGRCAISGCTILDVLEAAHIHPYRGPETNHVQNGLLLRADLHTLFDCGLIDVEPSTLTVVVDRKLRGTEYEAWHGQPLRRPRNRAHAPSKEALRLRKEERS